MTAAVLLTIVQALRPPGKLAGFFVWLSEIAISPARAYFPILAGVYATLGLGLRQRENRRKASSNDASLLEAEVAAPARSG
jgi:hypothetical protein